ncbi:MAG: hypothetical protein WCG25_09520 [bacterium]
MAIPIDLVLIHFACVLVLQYIFVHQEIFQSTTEQLLHQSKYDSQLDRSGLYLVHFACVGFSQYISVQAESTQSTTEQLLHQSKYDSQLDRSNLGFQHSHSYKNFAQFAFI